MRQNAEFLILLAQRISEKWEVVLGKRESDGAYVTWKCYEGCDYAWGHYFAENQLIDALNDFISRCTKI